MGNRRRPSWSGDDEQGGPWGSNGDTYSDRDNHGVFPQSPWSDPFLSEPSGSPFPSSSSDSATPFPSAETAEPQTVDTKQSVPTYYSTEGVTRRPFKRKKIKGIGVTLTGILFVFLLLKSFSFGWFDSGEMTGASDKANENPEVQSQPSEIPTASPAPQDPRDVDWVRIAEQVGPSVVALTVNKGDSGSAGAGVIIDNQGNVITNYHVVAGMQGHVRVSLPDSRVFSADLVGWDYQTDIAVLRILKPSKLSPATLGSSSNLQVGQPVAAIGNPLSLSSTMTTGIISALDRPSTVALVPPDQSTEKVLVTNTTIQIDASINPGNSGGPLFDGFGRVIGINTAVARLHQEDETAGSIGLNFALPINLAKRMADEIISHGAVEHVSLDLKTEQGLAHVGEDSYEGVQVLQTDAGGSGSQAGLKRGDVILSFDGKKTPRTATLDGLLKNYLPGDTVVLEYVRSGKRDTLTVTF